MNFKIININPPVLVLRDIDDHGNDIIRISAWELDAGDDFLREEEIKITF